MAAPADPACLDPDSLGAAEEYAIIYPERAALIRRLGRLPDDTSFGPPDDDVVHALVTAHTPVLAALDGFPIREAHRVPDHAFPEPCPVRACPGEGRGHGARAA